MVSRVCREAGGGGLSAINDAEKHKVIFDRNSVTAQYMQNHTELTGSRGGWLVCNCSHVIKRK